METPKSSRLVEYSDSESDCESLDCESPERNSIEENKEKYDIDDGDQNNSKKLTFMQRMEIKKSMNLLIEPFKMSERLEVVTTDGLDVDLEVDDFKLQFKLPGSGLDHSKPAEGYLQTTIVLNGSRLIIRIGDIFPPGTFNCIILFNNHCWIHFMDYENNCSITVMNSSEFTSLLVDFIPEFRIPDSCLFFTERLISRVAILVDEFVDREEKKDCVVVDLTMVDLDKSGKSSHSGKPDRVRKQLSKEGIDTSKILDT